jgi:hypothetical protein
MIYKEEFSSDEEEFDPKITPKQQESEAKVSPNLASLVVYQQTKKLHKLDHSTLSTLKSHNVSSLSEKKASKMIEQKFHDFLSFTENAFARIFPGGKRIDSSNLNPLRYWQAGNSY